MDEQKNEVESQALEKTKSKAKKIIFAVNAAIIVIVLAVILAVSCGKDSSSNNKSESVVSNITVGTVDSTAYDTETVIQAITTEKTNEKTTEAEDESEVSTGKGDKETETEIIPTTVEEATENTTDKSSERTDSETDKETDKATDKATDKETDKETTEKSTDKVKETTSVKETSIKQEETTKATAQQTTAVTTTKAPAVQPVKTENGTPYANHGKLTVSGTNILDQNGNVYQLKGVSTHGIQWFPQYVNYNAFKTLRDEWGVNVVRLAMYTHEGGYCSGGNKQQLRQLIDTGVQAATQLGMYVIIDWHVLNERYPSTYQNEAVSFFNEVSKTYAGYGNVIYEICNEPNSGPSWADVKAYAEKIIPIIRQNCNNIIIVGTPTWSQDVDQAAANPIRGQVNIMYALHFYAATHKDYLWNKMVNAIKAGLPIFVSEYGVCDASGNGGYDFTSANTWMSLMDQYKVSSCIWNLANKNESSCLIASSCSKLYGWTEAELTGEGKWFVQMMKGSTAGLGTTTPAQTQPQTQPVTQPAQTQPVTQPITQPTTQETTVAPTTQAAVQASSSNCDVNVINGNSWDGHAQFDISIRNTSSNTVTGWKLVLSFSENVNIESAWNGQMAVQGNTIVITADQDWNQTMAPGAEITAGLIVTYTGSATLISAALQ